jgi:hypothetical protein
MNAVLQVDLTRIFLRNEGCDTPPASLDWVEVETGAARNGRFLMRYRAMRGTAEQSPRCRAEGYVEVFTWIRVGKSMFQPDGGRGAERRHKSSPGSARFERTYCCLQNAL